MIEKKNNKSNEQAVSVSDKRNKYYLEALRIAALLLVMYNHSQAFMAYDTQTGEMYGISIFLSMICKIAVPVFFMISGALLLGKNESMKELFQKRMLRMILVLVIFSFLFCMKTTLKGESTFSLLSFLIMLPSKEVFLPYWYLYSYLGFLAILPFLRAMAQNLKRQHFYYLILLQLIFGTLFPVIGNLSGWWFNGYFDVGALFNTVVFYPLIGYGLDQYLKKSKWDGVKAVVYNLAVVVTAVISSIMLQRSYSETGVYQEYYLGYMLSVPAMVLFWNMKMLLSAERLSERVKKILTFVGDKVFGMYLLEGFIGCNGKMDIIARTLIPYTGLILAYIVEILCIFIIRLIIITVLKKIIVFKQIL